MKRNFFIFFLSIIINSYSQPRKDLQFIHYSIDRDLSSSEVTAIVQDKQGFIWVGTEDGLNRFDSYNFKVYKKKINDSSSLAHNYVNTLFVDSYDNLWAGTQHGISIYNKDLDAFSNCFPDRSKFSNQANDISSFAEDKDHKLYIGLKDGQLFVFNRQDNTFKLIKKLKSEIKYLFIDSDNLLWVLSDSIKIFNNRMELVKTINNKNVTHIFTCMLEDKDKFWICSQGSGTFWYDKKTKSLIKTLIEKDVYENYINSIYKDRDDNIWIGSANSLKLYNRNTNSFYYYKSEAKNKASMSTSGVISFLQDSEGNYWVLTSKGGVNLSFVRKKFINLNTEPQNNIVLTKSIISSILLDSDNNLLAGSYSAGLDYINLTKETVTHFEPNKSNSYSIGEGSVLMLYEDSRKIIWVGSYWGGLQNFNKSSETFYLYKNDPNYESNITSADYRDMTEDKNQNLWFVTSGKGLVMFNPKTKEFINYRQDLSNSKTGLVNNWLYSILCDYNGKIWIGSSFGLGTLDTEHKVFFNYYNNPEDSTSLSNNYINCIFEDSKKKLWIGTNEGLNLFDPVTKSFRAFYQHDGLPNNVIKGILEDNDGNLWISTNMGISKLDVKTMKFRNYDTFDGLASNEFNSGACAKGKNGQLFFGSNNGILMFFPDSIHNNNILPPVYITGFKIFNKLILANQGSSPLLKDITQTKEVTLKHDQSMVFSFEFVSVSYIQSEKKRYAYMMEGFDKNWVYCGNKREATYTNLDPGEYIFRVIASNNDGLWNKEGTSIKVIILPPWWESAWFRIFLLMCVISMLIGIYLYNIDNLKKQKIQLQKMVFERTKEIEDKNRILVKQTSELNETNVLLEEKQQYIEEQAMAINETNIELTKSNATKDKFFTIIAHDLKNPFNAILGFCELLILKYDKYDDDKRITLISTINESSKQIYRLLENLLQWSRSQTGDIEFKPEEFELAVLVNENISLVENSLLDKNLKIQTKGIENKKVIADRNMITTVIRNLLTNAIKFTENGIIRIECEQEDSFIRVKIVDTGIGIDPEKQKELFTISTSRSLKGTRGESGTGLGLLLCKDFIERNKGNITVESEKGVGSTFSFTLPAIND